MGGDAATYGSSLAKETIRGLWYPFGIGFGKNLVPALHQQQAVSMNSKLEYTYRSMTL
jgi:hypothetical protein